MRQRKLCANDINYSSNECNGHVKSLEKSTKHEYRITNGNKCRNIQINIDNVSDVCVHELQMKIKRSHRNRSQDHQVRTRFRNATIHFKFAFHRIILLSVVSLIVGSCIVNGQQRDPHENMQIKDIFNIHKSHYVIQPAIFDGKDQRKIMTTTRQTLYVPLNIFVALVGVVVWTEKNEIELSNNSNEILKNFENYQRKVLVKDHPNDNAQLLTKVQFDNGSVVGRGYLNTICKNEYSSGVTTYYSSVISMVAATIAHELGHNFGMDHDKAECKCERCIMSSSSIPRTQWSDCSIHQLNEAIHQGNTHCLMNVPKYLFEPSTCGNGFVEPGEECDCGLPDACKNTCCDAKTCKLNSNATCATGECCDLTTCQLHEAGYECRPSTGECDLSEYCDGNNEFCPLDYFKRDTEVCGNGKAYCYHGLCKSRDDQCKLLWGPSGKSSEQCYEYNLDGSWYGNCGFDRVENKYRKCSKEDIFCGRLQCRRKIIACQTVDLELESVDPGLAPDGSKCGDGKMCVSQKCIPIDTLRESGKVKDCATDCGKHGVCDNMGHCHCDKGFAPPNCESPGPGGSKHSGSPTNPGDGYGFAPILYVFFLLGVVVFISVSLLLFYYWRQKRQKFISQSVDDMKPFVRHYPERSPPPPPSAPLTQLSPSSTGDMNATLLKASNTAEDPIKRELFCNFKGFPLKPSIFGASKVAYVHPVAKSETAHEHCVPTRAAPLLPTSSPKKMQFKSSPKSSPSSYRYQNMNDTTKDSPETPIEVKLFATKSDAKERPKISHPVSENLTVSVKELIATANSAKNLQFIKAPLLKSITPNQSKNTQQKLNNLPLSTTEIGSGDKSTLKKLKISAPLEEASFSRSQSMGSPSTEKSPAKRNALASESMRCSPGKRPMVVDRPRNPPPPGTANGRCGSASLRNIYSNVKESPPQNGLLSEIVNEIENRNLKSIYSTSKKKPTINNSNEQTTYENINKPHYLLR